MPSLRARDYIVGSVHVHVPVYTYELAGCISVYAYIIIVLC